MASTTTLAPRLTALLAALLVLGGCSTTGAGAPDAASPGPGSAESTAPVRTAASGGSRDEDLGDTAADPAYARFYDQELAWDECGDGTRHECATAAVPLDWADPEAGAIELALRKAPARGEKIGSLLLNPGGPGVSGIDSVKGNLSYLATDELREAYDIIGFDPRGVGSSTPLTCFDDETMDEYRSAEYDLATEEGWAAGQEWAKRLATACAENTGPIIGHMDTESAARDMDVLRAALGEDQLDYLGFSYGTALGATYVDLYPQHAGRMILDAGLDPSLTPEERTRGQAAGFELAFTHYLEDCLPREDCPFDGTVDEAKQELEDLLTDLGESPLPTDDPDRPLTESLAVSGIMSLLYNDGYWGYLDKAIGWMMQGDGSTLLRYADASVGRREDGTYVGNSQTAFYGVNCLDSPHQSDREAMAAEAEKLDEISPTFGRYLGYSGMICDAWPEGPVDEPSTRSAEGADLPLVVIGTTGDPATPIEWSEALADQLGNARHVTWEGEGHAAYPRAGSCITDIVDGYLLDGAVPEDATVCE